VGGKAGIRWMELRNNSGTWSLYQEGTYAPTDGHHRWMGSIAMDATGNIALGYSISSSTLYPSIRYTGRLAGDPLGVMTIAEKGIINGGGSQTNPDGRWGDYSAMAADPVVDGKFWYTQQYYTSTSSANWKTRVGSFSFSNIFSTVTTAFPNPVCLGDSSQLNVSPNGGSGSYSYSWTSIPAGFTSTLQNPKVAPSVLTKYIAVTSDGTNTRTDTVEVSLGYKPTVSAGADTIVCWYVTSVPASGTISNYKQFGWSTTGSGSFSNSSTLSTIYYPSLNDKLNGSVDLKLVASPNPPCSGNVTSVKRVTFDVCTGAEEQNATEPALTIQPNPASGTVLIGIKGMLKGSSVLTITSMDGKTLHSENIPAEVVKKMDISGYPRGIYFVQLTTGSKIVTGKLVVQ
jgi:hypothetical protein